MPPCQAQRLSLCSPHLTVPFFKLSPSLATTTPILWNPREGIWLGLPLLATPWLLLCRTLGYLLFLFLSHKSWYTTHVFTYHKQRFLCFNPLPDPLLLSFRPREPNFTKYPPLTWKFKINMYKIIICFMPACHQAVPSAMFPNTENGRTITQTRSREQCLFTPLPTTSNI